MEHTVPSLAFRKRRAPFRIAVARLLAPMPARCLSASPGDPSTMSIRPHLSPTMRERIEVATGGRGAKRDTEHRKP